MALAWSELTERSFRDTQISPLLATDLMAVREERRGGG